MPSPVRPFQSVKALSGRYEIWRDTAVVNSPPSVPNSSLHQGTKVPLHSPLIVLDDCDDISIVADSSIPVEDSGTLFRMISPQRNQLQIPLIVPVNPW